MTPIQVILLVLYAGGMTAGQALFKLSSATFNQSSGDIKSKLISVLFSPAFIAAMLLYLTLSVLWVKILSFTPMALCYPFTALAFIFTAIVGVAVFQEVLSRSTMVGIAFIMIGILFIART